jgi:Peptidase A4 family
MNDKFRRVLVEGCAALAVFSVLSFAPKLDVATKPIPAPSVRSLAKRQIIGFHQNAKPNEPLRIVRLTAVPSVITASGGKVTLVAVVSGATDCRFTSVKPRLTLERSCSSGVRRVSFSVPVNHAASKQHFHFLVFAFRPGSNAKAQRAVSVTELSRQPPPPSSNSPTTSAPTVTLDPASQTVQSGATVTFNAASSGVPAPATQWELSTDSGISWIAIGDATSDSYSFAASPADSGVEFRAVFTNVAGTAASSDALLTVLYAPTITTPPTGESVVANTTAMFVSQATANPAPNIQWLLNTGTGFNTVPDETSECFSFQAPSTANGDQVEVVFSNAEGSVTSGPVSLMVGTSPNAGSENWSGFAELDPCAGFTSVSADWTVPTASCTPGFPTYSAEWVGIDGYGSSTVEQDGTEVDCATNGVPQYSAWYEMYGDDAEDGGYSVPLPAGDVVQPGDEIEASVQESADTWTLAMTDSTQSWTFSTQISFSGATRSSAEWVVERPLVCSDADSSSCTLSNLTDFGSVEFSSTQMSTDAGPGTLYTSEGEGIQMTDDGSALATPGSLTSDQEFGVTWNASS